MPVSLRIKVASLFVYVILSTAAVVVQCEGAQAPVVPLVNK